MKDILFALSILLFCASCSQSATNNSVTPAKTYYAVPNWQADTLIGLTMSGRRDTLFAYMSGGMSCVKYHGQQYELRAYAPDGTTFMADAETYIVDMFLNGVQVNAANTISMSAEPATYFKNAWQTQPETVYGMPFNSDIVGGFYSAKYK